MLKQVQPSVRLRRELSRAVYATPSLVRYILYSQQLRFLRRC